MRKLTVISVVLVLLLASGTATALYQAWVMRKIAVPAYGYFAKHGHCRTRDMVLVQVGGPDSITWKCARR